MKPLPKDSPIRSLLLILLGGLIVTMGALMVVFFSAKEGEPTPSPSLDVSQKVTEGKLVCLPHKDTRGPVTLECAFGLKTAANEHYALDTSAYNPGIFSELSMDSTIAVTGSVTPLAQVVDTSVKKYDIVGVIHVVDVEKKP